MGSKIRSVLAIQAIAGESPVWCADEQALYWVDVMAPAVHRFHPQTGRNETWKLPDITGSIAVCERGGLVAATRSGFCFVDIPSGRATPIVNPEPDRPNNTFNDGRCDRRGRFWAGSSWFGPEGRYTNAPAEPTGTFYRLDADHSCHPMVSGIGETDTIAWSPDDRTIYFGDSSKAAVIYAADWNAGAGTFENRRIFVRTGDGPGIHDGSAMDAEGFLWTCYWQGWRIIRYSPDGSVDRVVELPVKYPTSCTFGGDDLQMLYVTTACWYQTADELAAQPLAGNLLAFEPGVRGLPDAKYAG